MTTMGHVTGLTAYPLDFSNHLPEVLDLSRNNQNPRISSETTFCPRPASPQYHTAPINNITHSIGSINGVHTRREFPAGFYFPITYNDQRYSSSNESLNAYRSQTHSPTSLYSNDGRDVSRSPRTNTPCQLSPNYPVAYAAPEHLHPFILNAALQKQSLLQSRKMRRSESDVSDSEARSSKQTKSNYPLINTGRDGKITRPFKAFPLDTLSLANGLSAIDAESHERFQKFRSDMLEQIRAQNGGSMTVTNPRMRRTISSKKNEDGKSDIKDDAYAERRMKNNEAAKKSRDKRREKEDEIAIRAEFLQRENSELKMELAALRERHSACGLSLLPTTWKKL